MNSKVAQYYIYWMSPNIQILLYLFNFIKHTNIKQANAQMQQKYVCWIQQHWFFFSNLKVVTQPKIEENEIGLNIGIII